jgi:hypothetical protein
MGEVRDTAGRFVRGAGSPNPSGRPRGLAAAARAAIGDDPTEIVTVLLSIMRDTSARNADRLAAAREVLDRGWGRSASFQPIEGGDPLSMSELDAAIVEIASRLAGRRTDTPETN